LDGFVTIGREESKSLPSSDQHSHSTLCHPPMRASTCCEDQELVGGCPQFREVTVDLTVYPASELCNRSPEIGDLQPPTVLNVEGRSESRCELLDLHVQCGLGDVELLGRPSEVGVVGEYDETPQCVKSDGFFIYSYEL
jgi:hypothetical protein